MENASKALIMAAGILIGMLILALMVTLFASASSLNKSYNQSRENSKVQQFNVNFIKYIEKDLTIHDVLTIYNFAKQNGIEDAKIIRPAGFNFNTDQIKIDLNEAAIKLTGLGDPYYNVEKRYKLEIVEINATTGYISKIKFSVPTNKYKCYKKDPAGDTIIEYKS